MSRADFQGKPRLLDLFCGAGGAAMGYHRAGFEVVGVDIAPQPNYPFDFYRGDALTVLGFIGDWDEKFDAIHASPPCQAYSHVRNAVWPDREHPDLIPAVRDLLEATGLPWVIENVPGAPLRDPILICGSMFDPALEVKRHRLFEANWSLEPPMWPCRHKLWYPRFPATRSRRSGFASVVSVYGHGGGLAKEAGLWAHAMEIDWMTKREMAEAIPPAYTELIGSQLLQHVRQPAAVGGDPE